MHMWKWRNLSILGKIQIIKTFAIPKLMFRASVISMPNELVKEVNSILYNFIWNGKDKVKRWKTIIRSSLCKNEIEPIPVTPYIKLNCG